jgi:hypothetical protein
MIVGNYFHYPYPTHYSEFNFDIPYTQVQPASTYTTVEYINKKRFYYCSRPAKRWKK